MKERQKITWREWGLGITLFALVFAYILWAFQFEHYVKFIRAGAANELIWRALNTDQKDFPDAVNQLSGHDIGIPDNPVRCDKSLENIEFPARCIIFDRENGGKALTCDFWWLGRNCRIIYVSQKAWERPHLHTRISYALTNPCQILQDPSSASGGENIISEFWLNFGCEDKLRIMPVETLVLVRHNGKTIRIERFVANRKVD